MKPTKLLPDSARILSGSALKVIAVVTMLIDHLAGHVLDKGIVLFSFGNHTLLLTSVMRFIGRMAFPLFAFLIVEGFIHTHSRLKYGINLFVFALISEVPWDLLHHGKWLSLQSQNVFFTLFFGYLGLCVIEYLRSNPVMQIAVLLIAVLTATIIRCDYGAMGVVFIILMYALREHELARPLISFLLYLPWMVLLAFVPISMYNGKRGFVRGKVLKYAFYAFYPVHMLVLYLFKFHVLF